MEIHCKEDEECNVYDTDGHTKLEECFDRDS